MTSSLRPAAVAGTFYPDSSAVLGAVVDGLLTDADVASSEPVPKALIVPHAGYVYSGPIAASAYARLRGASRIERVILVGPTHRVWVRGVVSPGAKAFETPLGEIAVDAAALARVPEVPESARAHAAEHSLEVQLPFVQRVLPRARIVPLAVGDASVEEMGRLLEALWGGPETLVIVSSDLSHYLPYAEGRAIDKTTAARIVAMDEHAILPDQACGSAGINGLLWVARRKGLEARLLDLRSSGDTAGRKREVVGYGAFAFYEAERAPR